MNYEFYLNLEKGPVLSQQDFLIACLSGNLYISEWEIIHRKGGIAHRDFGPAVMSVSGIITWFKNGLIHNEYGHAIFDTKRMISRYYLDGFEISYEEWLRLMGEKYESRYFVKRWDNHII